MSSYANQTDHRTTRADAYLWALRWAFARFGRPKVIQVDRDSGFVDTRSSSPFPSRFHLYLVGLGIELVFIKYAPPRRQAKVERSHQIMDGWVFKQKGLDDYRVLFDECAKAVRQYNEVFTAQRLSGKTLFEQYPDLYANERTYAVDREYELWCIERVKKYLKSKRFSAGWPRTGRSVWADGSTV